MIHQELPQLLKLTTEEAGSLGIASSSILCTIFFVICQRLLQLKWLLWLAAHVLCGNFGESLQCSMNLEFYELLEQRHSLLPVPRLSWVLAHRRLRS